MADALRNQHTFTVTGTLTRDEYDEAAKTAGLFRRGRAVVVLATVFTAAAGVSLRADGVTLHPVLLGIAAAMALLGLVVLPRLLTARGFHRGGSTAEQCTTVDEDSLTVCRDGQTTRLAWDQIRWYHATPRLHVLVGRSGRTCLLALPERLFADPSESDRFGAFAAGRAGDRP
ncbi:YcxB family protein [Streptomyces sp. NPDC093801]|uniref:YcxB family protein n=1 Tax=Streptomyces sp. NPDC093801 TaxID=3155203 RepID=UPI00344C0EFF